MSKIIPNLSVDCVVFGFDHGNLNVLLTERKLTDERTEETLLIDYTVQGHHVLEGENLDLAAKRVLKEKTGLENIFLEQFHTFGDRDRMSDPRDKLWVSKTNLNIADYVVSVGYYFLGELYADTGQKDKARETLEKALSMMDEMGMMYWPDRAREVLARL